MTISTMILLAVVILAIICLIQHRKSYSVLVEKNNRNSLDKKRLDGLLTEEQKKLNNAVKLNKDLNSRIELLHNTITKLQDEAVIYEYAIKNKLSIAAAAEERAKNQKRIKEAAIKQLQIRAAEERAKNQKKLNNTNAHKRSSSSSSRFSSSNSLFGDDDSYSNRSSSSWSDSSPSSSSSSDYSGGGGSSGGGGAGGDW